MDGCRDWQAIKTVNERVARAMVLTCQESHPCLAPVERFWGKDIPPPRRGGGWRDSLIEAGAPGAKREPDRAKPNYAKREPDRAKPNYAKREPDRAKPQLREAR